MTNLYKQNILKKGFIIINNNKYKYYLFDIYQLNDIIENDKIFTNLLENTIITYREDKNFKIHNLFIEYMNKSIYNRTLFFIIYKGKDIISTCRFLFNLDKKAAYFNLIYTNAKYRGKKICQNNIKHMIDITNTYIKKYELEVAIENIPAIKCYQKNGFEIIKENSHSKEYLMQLII